MIKFNKSLNKWEGSVNGKVVTRSVSKEKVEVRLQTLGVQSTEVEVAGKKSEVVKFGVNERFEFIEKFVKMVARGVSNSLIVAGPGGLGKTYTVSNTLQAMGKTELGIGDVDGDYIIMKGYSTAKFMYRTLYENNGKIVIFDDCDAVLKDPIAANILKSALDSNEQRIISWGAEFSKDEELPNRFEFVGRVIFISNMSLTKIPQAIISRSLKCDVSMTTEEKLDRIENIIFGDAFLPTYGREVKVDTMQFLRKYADQAGDLNIRTALNVAKIRYNDDDGSWVRVALYMMVA
jgi:hypothetical protein